MLSFHPTLTQLSECGQCNYGCTVGGKKLINQSINTMTREHKSIDISLLRQGGMVWNMGSLSVNENEVKYEISKENYRCIITVSKSVYEEGEMIRANGASPYFENLGA